jgi:hypothetical protein
MSRGRSRLRWVGNIKLDLRKIRWKIWTGFNWLRIGISGGCCEHGNELSGSMEVGELFGYLSDY